MKLQMSLDPMESQSRDPPMPPTREGTLVATKVVVAMEEVAGTEEDLPEVDTVVEEVA